MRNRIPQHRRQQKQQRASTKKIIITNKKSQQGIKPLKTFIGNKRPNLPKTRHRHTHPIPNRTPGCGGLKAGDEDGVVPRGPTAQVRLLDLQPLAPRCLKDASRKKLRIVTPFPRCSGVKLGQTALRGPTTALGYRHQKNRENNNSDKPKKKKGNRGTFQGTKFRQTDEMPTERGGVHQRKLQ